MLILTYYAVAGLERKNEMIKYLLFCVRFLLLSLLSVEIHPRCFVCPYSTPVVLLSSDPLYGYRKAWFALFLVMDPRGYFQLLIIMNKLI